MASPTPRRFTARAVYAFNGESEVELTLKPGDIVNVLRTEVGDGWWEGELPNGTHGLFPKDYVQPLPSQQQLKSDSEDDLEESSSTIESKVIMLGDEKRYTIVNGPRWEQPSEIVRVTVGNPAKQSKYNGMKQFIAYEVEAGSPLHSRVQRRYKHFTWLYDRLRQTFSCVAVPRLPDKSVQANFVFDDAFIEKRRRGLELFLNRVARHPVLGNSNAFLHFLTATDNTDWKLGKRSAEREATESLFLLDVKAPEGVQPETKDVDEFTKFSKRIERALGDLSYSIECIHSKRQDLKWEYHKTMGALRALVERSTQRMSRISSAVTSQELVTKPLKVDSADQFCWRENCKECLSIVKMMGKVHEGLAKASDIIDHQSTSENEPLAEILRDQMGLLKTIPSIVKVHDHAIETYNQTMLKDKETPGNLANLRRKCDTMTNVLLSELDSYHTTRILDFREGLRAFTAEQLTYHRKMTATWQELNELVERM